MAGDARFKERARLRLERLVIRARLWCSPPMWRMLLRPWCTRIIWLEGGEIRQDGLPGAVLDAMPHPSDLNLPLERQNCRIIMRALPTENRVQIRKMGRG